MRDELAGGEGQGDDCSEAELRGRAPMTRPLSVARDYGGFGSLDARRHTSH